MLLVVLLIILFFAVRWHFYKIPLSGEDGMFAEMMVHPPDSPKNGLYGRFDGQGYYGILRHPVMLYNVLIFGARLSSPLLADVPWQEDAKITPPLRFICSLFQFVIFLAIAVYLVFRKQPVNVLLAIIFIGVVISPISVKAATALQVDNTTGALMAAIFSMVILFILSGGLKGKLAHACLFAATAFFGMGKQEWSMVLLIALLVTTVYLCVLRMKTSANVRPDILMLLTILAGVVAGNIFSYLVGPYSYLGGLRVFWDHSRVEDIASGSVGFDYWLRLTCLKLKWMCTVIALIAISLILAFNKFKQLKPLEILFLLFGIGLFAAYFISVSNINARYYIPSLVVTIFAIIALFPTKLTRKTTIAISVIVIMMFATNGVYLLYKIGFEEPKPYFDPSRITLAPDHIAILSPADAWNKPQIDFLSYYMGRSSVERLAAEHNKTLWPEDFFDKQPPIKENIFK